VAFVRTDVFEERFASTIRMKRIILLALMMEATLSFETSLLTIFRRRYIPEDGILHSHRRENLTFYKHSSCSSRFADYAILPVPIHHNFGDRMPLVSGRIP
jgi:hypothetical protein